MTSSHGTRLDIVGVGALNVDIVVDLAGTGRQLRDDEAAVCVDEMDRLLTEVAGLPRRVALGGSSFKVVTTVAGRQPRLRLGFVGVEGEAPLGAPSFRDHLDELGVDVAALGTAPGHAGICLVLEDRDVRSLRVAPGANTSMADRLAAGHVADYLARARVVHVTSFLDERTPHALADVLARLRGHASRPLLCLDPGHDWCARPGPAVRRLVAAADLVLVNEGEFADLGGAVDLGSHTVVVKHPGYAVVHRHGATRRVDGGVPPLRPEEIRYPTNAGDAFAAGLLGALVGNAKAVQAPDAVLAADLAGPVRSGLEAARAHLSGESLRAG